MARRQRQMCIRDRYNVNAIDRHQVTGRYCTLRNNTPLDQLQSGMGDIFIKLAR